MTVAELISELERVENKNSRITVYAYDEDSENFRSTEICNIELYSGIVEINLID